jgi:hypothetical protein
MTHQHAVVIISCLLTSIVSANTVSTFIIPSGVEVTIIESTFDKDIFSVERCSSNDSICRINKKFPYGVDIDFPKTYVKSITVSLQGRSYALDATGMYNAWGGRPLEHHGVIRYFGGGCSDNKNCQFRGIFSDGSGSFVAEWLVVDGLATRSIITGSDDVVNLFKNNIDPPGTYLPRNN